MSDQQRTIVLGMALLFVFAILPLASASVSVSFPDPAVANLNPSTPSQIVEFQNQNLSEAPTISLSLSSAISNVAQLSASTLSVPNKASVTVSIKSGAPAGSYSGSLFYTGGSMPVTVFIESTAQNVTQSPIIVFPTSKVISVQQEAEKTQNIQINVPSSYPRVITINAVNFNPGTDPISFGDLNLGQVQPGSSINIPIVFSGKDAQTGTYATDLTILATDSQGQVPLPTINLQLQITAGVAPATDQTFNTKPSCALSSQDLNLNQTYSFTCSNAVSNLDIVIPSSDYYTGNKVELAGGVYKYEFTPKKVGNTEFKAEFRYKGASIFEPYVSELRISSAGQAIPGTVLRFSFTPTLENAKAGEPVLIQLVDNKTGSLVNSPIVQVDARDANKSGDFSFEYLFEFRKNYELRGKAPGYEDLVQTINIDPKSIEIYISPTSGDENTVFNITTSIPNSTLAINGFAVTNPYFSTISPGQNTITASKDGYASSTINISVEGFPRINAGGANFKKGEKQTLTLSKEANWTVYYQKSVDSVEREVYDDLTGQGSSIEFTPKKSGIYTIDADGRNIGTYQADGFSLSNKWWIMPVWGWLLLVLGTIILFVVIAYMKGEHGDEGDKVMYPLGGE